jgi:uncharacterized DUF497 family protein
MMQFEWDENKNAVNIEKHGIDFSTAIAVFDDPNRFEEDSTKPEYNEVRIKTIGKVDAFVFVLTVVYTNRDEKRRIISARPANKTERQKYNESLIN